MVVLFIFIFYVLQVFIKDIKYNRYLISMLNPSIHRYINMLKDIYTNISKPLLTKNPSKTLNHNNVICICITFKCGISRFLCVYVQIVKLSPFHTIFICNFQLVLHPLIELFIHGTWKLSSIQMCSTLRFNKLVYKVKTLMWNWFSSNIWTPLLQKLNIFFKKRKKRSKKKSVVAISVHILSGSKNKKNDEQSSNTTAVTGALGK